MSNSVKFKIYAMVGCLMVAAGGAQSAPSARTSEGVSLDTTLVAESLRRCSMLGARSFEDGSECKSTVRFEQRLIERYAEIKPAITAVCMMGLERDRGRTVPYDTETLIQCIEG